MVARNQNEERGSFVLTRNDAPITILLVDDDPDCRLLVRDAISGCKMSNDVHEVCNGLEALQFLRKAGPHASAPRPGLVYLDIEMPGMDGLETLKQIKSDPALRDIPVVMMTGVCEEAQMKQAAALGANSYTLKPANAEQFLRNRAGQHQLLADDSSAPGTPSAAGVVQTVRASKFEWNPRFEIVRADFVGR